MSVTAETCQVEMGPYVAVAEAALELYAVTAVCNSALVANFLLQSVLQAPCGSPPCGKVSLVSVMQLYWFPLPVQPQRSDTRCAPYPKVAIL